VRPFDHLQIDAGQKRTRLGQLAHPEQAVARRSRLELPGIGGEFRVLLPPKTSAVQLDPMVLGRRRRQGDAPGLAKRRQGVAIGTSVTVTAPPMRVAIWANGISCMRLAALRMATSPVPPWPQRQAATMPTSMGYMPISRATPKPVPTMAATVATMVTTFARVK